MLIKTICIEYILWGIPPIESTFDVANMVKTATVKDVQINNDALLNIQVLYFCLGKWYLLSCLVVPLISARVSLFPLQFQAIIRPSYCYCLISYLTITLVASLLISGKHFIHIGCVMSLPRCWQYHFVYEMNVIYYSNIVLLITNHVTFPAPEIRYIWRFPVIHQSTRLARSPLKDLRPNINRWHQAQCCYSCPFTS